VRIPDQKKRCPGPNGDSRVPVTAFSIQRSDQVRDFLPPFQLFLDISAFLGQPGENLAQVE